MRVTVLAKGLDGERKWFKVEDAQKWQSLPGRMDAISEETLFHVNRRWFVFDEHSSMAGEVDASHALEWLLANGHQPADELEKLASESRIR